MKTTLQPRELSSDLVLEESIDIGIVTGLMKNYRNAIEAIFELIDNSVDDRIEDNILKIDILLGRDFIQISNIGGAGMGLEELTSFLKWGSSLKRGKLGRYGQGGKAAMGYLGNRWKLKSSKAGENETYIIEEDDWRSRFSGKKKYKPRIYLGETPREQGKVVIEIKNLSRKINKSKLIEALSDYYRMLLADNKIIIKIDGEKIKPIEFSIIEKKDFFEFIEKGKKINGWVGLSKPNISSKGGIRCCVLGRKITENEYFGHHDYSWKGSLGRIIGEVNADFLELNLNKTGFDVDSFGWQKVSERMYKMMQPYIEYLLNEKDEEKITEDEKEKHKTASKIWNDFIKNLSNENKIVSKTEINDEDFDMGQKPLENKGIFEDLDRSTINTSTLHNPATPPPDNAIGKRRRLKRFLGVEAEPGIIPDDSIRSELKEKEGKEVIIINKIFPGYKKRKGDQLYIWETIAMEYSKPDKGEKMDHDEYVKEINKTFSKFCKYLENNRIRI